MNWFGRRMGDGWIRECDMVARELQGGPSENSNHEVKVRQVRIPVFFPDIFSYPGVDVKMATVWG